MLIGKLIPNQSPSISSPFCVEVCHAGQQAQVVGGFFNSEYAAFLQTSCL